MTSPNADPAGPAGPAPAARAGRPPAARAGRPPVQRGFFGREIEEDDTPLPDLPPLPADPRWRIEHLPMLTAIAVAVTLCAASVGFLAGGATAALGAAAGVLIVTVSFTLSTLVVAWADTVRPALLLPLGLLTYVVKYALIVLIMINVAVSGWSGGRPMAWGIVGGAVVLTVAQVWWVSRLARRRLAAVGPSGGPSGPPGVP